MRLPTYLTAVILGLTLLARPLSAEIIDRVAAVVNDEVITLYELEQAHIEISAELAAKKGTPPILKAELLDKLVNQKLVEQEVERQGIKITELELKKSVDGQQERLGLNDEQFEVALSNEGLTLDKYREQLRQQMIMVRLVGQEVRSEVKVTQQEVESYYSHHLAEFRSPPQLHLRHIFLPYPTGADDKERERVRLQLNSIRRQILAGADFARMARKYSRGPSATQGGDLGWFEEGQLLDAFQKQIDDLEPGQVSSVFEETPGYHLLLLEEVKPGEQLSLEQVKDGIRELLYQQKVMERYELWMERLRAQSHIEVRYQG